MATIEGFDNYLIYPDGKVFSIKSDMYINGTYDKHNYHCITLRKNNKTYIKKVHRLLGQAFIPNPENKPQIDHIDRNPCNNDLSNLRWVNNSENQQNTGISKNNKLGIKYISPTSNGGYQFRKITNGISNHKHFKTLDEAIEYKETYLNNNE